MSSNEFSASETPAPDSSDVVARVAQQVAVLDSLAGRPLAEHAGIYQRLHAELQETLGGIDSA